MEPKKTPVSKEAAQASHVFDQLCAASTLKSILGHHRHLCELLRLKPSTFPQFYPKLKSKLCSWKAKALWTKFDKRASHKCYNRGKACSNTKVLIIGGGPCGLRTAIEAQLLGAKVVVVEKRDRISRHNVLHLWPFVIHDLKALNAKKFFGKFCAGAIDHISIRQLQCILLKVALILGVEFHEGVGFDSLIPPAEDQSVEKNGWRAKVTPADHPVSQYEFDVLIGADGKRNTLEGFKRKEFRGKLAIAITANFINRHTEAEARVEEISGVAFIFNQKFFKDLYEATGIDLENIVYYKDETHYFVMTAKKHSLINNGVILQDYPDTIKLLSSENKDKDALMKYARDAAEFSTGYLMTNLEFAVDHYGQPDVAMFDFTSMFAAENASRVVERHGYRLLQMLVGDSLLEPFWPTGSGCARGFLSSLDACWAIKSWAGGQVTPLEVLAERESIYRLLAQTTPENLHRDYAGYTLDPHTRYPNLNKQCVSPIQVKGLFDTDDPTSIELPQILHDLPKKRRRKDSQVHPDTLLHWLKKQVALYDNVHIENMTSSFKDGLVLCAIIYRYRPDLLDFHALSSEDVAKNNQLAFDTLERELGIPPVMTGLEMEQCDVPDKLAMLSYLSQLYDTFRGEIPHIKHPKLEPEVLDEPPAPSIHAQLRNLKPDHKVSLMARLTSHQPRVTPSRKRFSSDRESGEGGTRVSAGDKRVDSAVRRPRKRRSQGRPGASTEEAVLSERNENVQQNSAERERRKGFLRKLAAQHVHKSMHMLETNDKDESTQFEDYDILVYRQTAPNFVDRVKELERKLLDPEEVEHCERSKEVQEKHFELEQEKHFELEQQKCFEPKREKRFEPKQREMYFGDEQQERHFERETLEKRWEREQQQRLFEREQRQFQFEREQRERRLERERRNEFINDFSEQQFYRSLYMLDIDEKNDSALYDDEDLYVYRQSAPNFEDRVKALERKLVDPDREARIQEEIRKEGGIGPDENMTDKIKMIEEKLKGKGPTDKKPKDLNRAIGKIEKSDWNVKEIERKIQENKLGRNKRLDRGEKVPKWSREQFDDKFQAMKAKLQRKSVDKDKEREKDKYAEIDEKLKLIDRKTKEGNVLDMGQRGSNKVSALAEQLAYKTQEPEKPALAKSSSKTALVMSSQGGSEACHFCKKRVYLMERLSAEGKFFHRGCFRCEYCSTTLRLGNYGFDRDGKHGSRFFCMQHFSQLTQFGTQMSRVRRKSDELRTEVDKDVGRNNKTKASTPKSEEKAKSLAVAPLKILDTDTTDLRKSSESLGLASDEDDGHSEMDEDEWTDRNFGASAAEGSSDSSVNSDLSDSEDEPNEVFEEALEPPLNATETLRLAETWTRRYSRARNGEAGEEGCKDEEDESESYEDGSDDSCAMASDSDTDDEESDTATEGEDEICARELRKLEVPPERPRPHGNSDTGTDTEVGSDEYTTESESEEENSATEISTDSEFDHDGTTPTQHEVPSILIDDVNATNRKQRIYEEPKKVQARTCHIIRPVNGTVGKPTPLQRTGIKLDLKPLRAENELEKSSSLSNIKPGINNINNNNTKLTTVVVPTPLINPRAGDYLLNRTHSTEGIASKLSLELKKRYLLGPSGLAGSVKKSGSASTLDSTIKSVVDVISEQQKLLRPAVEPSPTMQAFLQGTSKPRHLNGIGSSSPSLPPIISPSISQHPSLTSSLGRKDPPAMELPFEHVCGLRDKDEPVRPNTASDVALDTQRSNAAAPSKVESPLSTSLANGMGSYKTTEGSHLEQEADCRPRSPVHETSIVVPDISWTKKPDDDADDIESDSLSSEDSSDSIEDEGHRSRSASPVAVSRTPPRVEIHNSSGELMHEGMGEVHGDSHKSDNTFDKTSAPTLPSSTEPSAKRPNVLIALERPCALAASEKSSPSSPPSTKGEGSESLNNEATLALTETEWSDWAQDSDVGVSEDLEDIEFNINPQHITVRKHQKPKSRRGHSTPARMALCEDFNDMDEFPQHVCGRKDEQKLSLDETSSNTTSRLHSNIDNIEFMDTGEEDDSGTDDLLSTTNKTLIKNRGYVQFVNTDEEDLETPIVETPKLPHLSTPQMVVFSECGETSDGPDPASLEAVGKNLVVLQADDEESYLQLEVTSTEETTTSEPTTIKDSPLEPPPTSMEDPFYTPKYEGKFNCDTPQIGTIEDPSGNNYEDYVRRLQGRISPFSNVRDSIDIRKSRRPVSSAHPQELVYEDIAEIADIGQLPSVTGATTTTTGISKKLEEISREKSKQKNLVHEMVLGKIQRKSQERKNKRSITSSPISPSVPPPILPVESKASPKNETNSMENTPPSLNVTVSPSEPKSSPLPTVDKGSERRHSLHHDSELPLSDVSTSHNNSREEYFTPLTSFKKCPQVNARQRPLSVHSSFRGQRPAKYISKPAQLPDTPLTNPEAFSCPDIQKALFRTPDDPFKTPMAPPRSRLFDTKTVDRDQVREEARVRARLKSDEELGLSPEDNIRNLRQKVPKRPGISRTMSESSERAHTIEIGPSTHLFLESTTTNPLFIDSDGANPAVNRVSASFAEGATCEHMRPHSSGPNSPVSAPACLTPMPRERHKVKEPERRKSSISQAMSKMSDFFHKAKKEASGTPSPPKTPDNKTTKDRFSRFKFTTKTKEKGKDKLSASKEEVNKIPMRSKSLEDQIDRRRSFTEHTPPPIPPPPVNYVGNGAISRVSEDSLSENEEESRVTAHSTPTHAGESSVDGAASSSGKKHSRMSRRVSRQVQLKRLRMAQEVQRQLEEVEVKQRELERRGVIVEKALRGEGTEEDLQGEEEDLFREWFDLVREQSELRRYERELLLRAQELELEDRHARLQQELREKMSIDEANKTPEDVVKEGQILAEMLDIVERKDSLVTLLEEDRQRYQAEDRDLEAQMLAKGLRLTPIRKESHV